MKLISRVRWFFKDLNKRIDRYFKIRAQHKQRDIFLKNNFPPENAPDSYGFATTAPPNYKARQDPELVESVRKLLESNKTCPHCGGQMKAENGLVFHRS